MELFMPSPSDVKRIQKRLEKEQYAKIIVSDLRAFPMILAKYRDKDGTMKLTPQAQISQDRCKAWSKGELGHITPVQSLPAGGITVNTCMERVRRMNANPRGRVSECSNFAAHAIGVLLDDPVIRDKFNVALVGMMDNHHNIAVLVPKSHELKSGETELPRDALIVDPWGLAMGYAPSQTMGVDVEHYAFKETLFENFTVNYQSMTDPTLAETEPNQLIPFSGGVSPEASAGKKVWKDGPGLWAKPMDPKDVPYVGGAGIDDPQQQTIGKIKNVLRDYTKGSGYGRFITGRWIRHHLADVDSILQKRYDSVESILQDIVDIKDVDPKLSLAKRMDFIFDKMKELGVAKPEPAEESELRASPG